MTKIFNTSFKFTLVWSGLVSTGAIVGFALDQLLNSIIADRDYVIAIFLFIFVIGLFIGLGQWFAINIRLRNVWRWIPATAIGYSVGGFGSYIIYSILREAFLSSAEKYQVVHQWIGPMSMLLLIGMFTGALQWLALGRKLKTSFKWIIASGLSLVIGVLSFTIPVGKYETMGTDTFILFGIISIIVFALFTGVFAGQIIMRSETDND